jgi:pseudouridine-5'-phosphate glycosidase
MFPNWLTVAAEPAEALRAGRPVVALESTLITHGLPWPTNLETAVGAENAVRLNGAVPATVAVIDGRPTLGLTADQIERLAQANGVTKASARDLGPLVAKGGTAGTTVAATMALAHAAGVRVFATGGIGGAHRGEGMPFDISSDLHELSRTPVLVVCAGAKSILDLPRTLEILETFGVPVFGYGTDEFPAFYVRSQGLPVSARVDDPAGAAKAFAAHVRMGGRGAVLAQPVDDRLALPAAEFDAAFLTADAEARAAGITGGQLTPFLLGRLAELTIGRTLAANEALIVANAGLAAKVAGELVSLGP